MALLRRARPLLGTLVEIGATDACAIDAAFASVAHVHARMSRFDAASDIGRFHALGAGEAIEVDRETAEVLAAAARFERLSDGAFDIALGSAPDGWRIDACRLTRLSARTRLDLGGIAKGHAVDRAVAALQAQGCRVGFVNAGGDLRAFGDLELPIVLRDERAGGVRPFCTLSDGAFATSFLSNARAPHVSVAAPSCMHADALAKVVAVSGRLDHPLLAACAALAWRH
jgi:thiamine biosynthesis lipoprotein